MSRSQSIKTGVISKRGNEIAYKIIAVNFYGKSLEPIRDEFLKLGLNGLRRRVIVIDMEAERKRVLDERAKKPIPPARTNGKRRSKASFDLGLNVSSEAFLRTIRSGGSAAGGATCIFDVTVAMMAIQRLRRQYDETTAALNKEREFDLMSYWQSTLSKNGPVGGARKPSMSSNKTIEKELLRKKRLSAIHEDDDGMVLPNMVCATLTPQVHNRIGRPPPLTQKKYIEDEPEDSKIFIILVGTFENSFYFELIKRGEPLQAIINFLPGENAYDLLVPNQEHQVFVMKKIEELTKQIYEMRKKTTTKPTGVFQFYLPKISVCMAQKSARKIYDQLSWAFYDIEMLQRNYNDYYLTPFRLTNVTMPRTASLEEAYFKTASVSLQGSYLQNPLPAINSDAANVILYVDMLFNTIDKPKEILTEWETVLLSTPLPKRIYSIYSESVNILAKRYADAFFSITKIKKAERLFVEENNTLLTQMVRYVDHELFRHIYLACLEYKLQRTYINNEYHRNAVPYRKWGHGKETPLDNFNLPKYAKFFATDDSVVQRLLHLLDDYDDYVVSEIRPAHKLYKFSRNLYEIIENNRMYTIPTRLCFRDFTLFRLEEFLTALMATETNEDVATRFLSEVERFEMLLRRLAEDYSPDIFIRPNSLKARRIVAVSALLGLRASSTLRRSSTLDTARERELQMANEALMSFSTRKSSVGLTAAHPMLQGYNLENIRQEIWVKKSKYYFEEGNIHLYEERWNFKDTNKNLSFKLNGNTLFLNTPKETVTEIMPLLRVQTANDISIRFQPDPKECAKIVVNYPNGLGVFYQEKHTEQEWSRDETPANERRRVMTSHGAVIVHYLSGDMILIMRYNGEIYRLYQYEIDFAEAEAGEEISLFADSATDQNTLSSTRSRFLLQMLQKEHSEKNERTDRSDFSRVPPEARPMKQPASPKLSGRKQDSARLSINGGGDTGDTAGSIGSSISLGSYVSDREPDQSIVADELRYLEQLMNEYNFKYKHLIITTTSGRIFNLMISGKFYEATPLKIEEWHDYYINESYAMRDDGVRMIWGSDFLKCFHADGTVIHTMTDDVLHTFDFDDDEFAAIISESSSHRNYEDIGDGDLISPVKSDQSSPKGRDSHDSRESTGRESRVRGGENENELNEVLQTSPKKPFLATTYEPFLGPPGDEDEEEIVVIVPTHPGYICALIGRQEYHHRNYASVYFLPHFIHYEEVRYIMEIKGANDVIIQKAYEPPVKAESSTHASSESVLVEEEQAEKVSTKSPTFLDGAGDGDNDGVGAGGDGPLSPLLNSSLGEKDGSLDFLAIPHLANRENSATASFAASKSLHVTSPVHSSGTTTSPTITPFSRQTPTSASQMVEVEEPIELRENLKVWIGADYYIVAAEEDVEVQAVINKKSKRDSKGILRNTIKFKIAYVENLQDVFHMIVAQIANCKKNAPKTKEDVYFLEKITNDCNLKGLEFYEELPELGPYHLQIGNTITQFTELETIFEKFTKNFETIEEDMAKFPRFRYKPIKPKTPLDKFPMVLSVKSGWFRTRAA